MWHKTIERRNKMRYIIIGGKPYTGYTGTMTYTGLRIVAETDHIHKIKKLYENNYDQCGGLLLIIDTVTSKECKLDW